MPPVRFGIYTVLGCIPWTAALAWTGHLVGKNWGNVVSALHGPSYALAGLIGLLVIFAVIVLVRRRRERGDHRSHAEYSGHSGRDEYPGHSGQVGHPEPASTAPRASRAQRTNE